MYLFHKQNAGHARKISAHRQTWMNSDALDMTPSTKLQTEQSIQNEDRNLRSRYRDSYAAQRASMTIYELIDAENVRARAMAAAYDLGDMTKQREAARVGAPITIINELLQQSNLPITLTIKENERVMARKNNGPEYSAAELSDGERNALLIAGTVLTARSGTLLIIDEPERHLHRAIILPLLIQLFHRRADCGFVVSTHDPDLPFGIDGARTVLLRSCSFSGQSTKHWEADELHSDVHLDDVLKRDLFGARRKIIFVEGVESSLDKTLFSVVFPDVSIIPKGDCKEVERAVVGTRGTESIHWLRTFGIVDSDGFDETEIVAKRKRGVYAFPYYSVEAIYYHPFIIRKIASRRASLMGGDSDQLADKAICSGVTAVRDHRVRLSVKAGKKAVRKHILERIPSDDDLLCGEDVHIANEAKSILASHTERLEKATEAGDWESILKFCSVRESPALKSIIVALGFRHRQDYQRAVRHLLTEDEDALRFVRCLFGQLTSQILD